MSIEFENGDLPELGRMEISCDFPDCRNTNDFEGDFRECISQAKESGWVVYRDETDDGQWCHLCPEHKDAR